MAIKDNKNLFGRGLRGILWALVFWGVLIVFPCFLGWVQIIDGLRNGQFKAFDVDWWDVVSLFVFCLGVCFWLWGRHEMANFLAKFEAEIDEPYRGEEIQITKEIEIKDENPDVAFHYVYRKLNMSEEAAISHFQSFPPKTVEDIKGIIDANPDMHKLKLHLLNVRKGLKNPSPAA